MSQIQLLKCYWIVWSTYPYIFLLFNTAGCTLLVLESLGTPSGMDGADEASSR